jgi:hypothetical protein
MEENLSSQPMLKAQISERSSEYAKGGADGGLKILPEAGSFLPGGEEAANRSVRF